MKITIAEVKRLLPVGREFIGEFVGQNTQICKPGNRITRRRVKVNTSQLISELLEGPDEGKLIYLTWKGVTADFRDGSIYLIDDRGQEFLKIIFSAPTAVPFPSYP